MCAGYKKGYKLNRTDELRQLEYSLRQNELIRLRGDS
jgi:hypothetical protein